MVGSLLTITLVVVQGNFRPVFQYISDTGAYPIENGLFALVFAIMSLLAIMVMYIRYKDAYIHLEGRFYRAINVIILLIGIAAIFFLMTVAALQFDDSPLLNHFYNACAGIAIILQVIYAVCQTIIGILLPPQRVWWDWVIFAAQLILIIILATLVIYFFASIFCADQKLVFVEISTKYI